MIINNYTSAALAKLGFIEGQYQLIDDSDGLRCEWVDGVTPPSDADVEAEYLPLAIVSAVVRVNLEAKRRIALIVPPDLETRNLSIAIEIQDFKRTNPDAALPEPLATYDVKINAAKDALWLVRNASNTMTAEVEALTTVDAVEAYDIATNGHWPA